MNTTRQLVQILIVLCNLVQMVKNYSATIRERQGKQVERFFLGVLIRKNFYKKKKFSTKTFKLIFYQTFLGQNILLHQKF